MIDIFTSTTSILSKEFIESFPAEKLALTLFKVGQETGVEFNKQKKGFSIAGHWNALLQAHKTLEHVLDSEKFRRFCDDAYPFPEGVVSSETQKTPEKKAVLSVTEDGRRGRKPGSSVMRSVSSPSVPDPVVLYQYNKSNVVNQELLKPSNLLNVFEDEAVTPTDAQNAMKTDMNITKQEDSLINPTESNITNNDINETLDDNSCNDDDDTSFVHDDGDDSSTDIDEKYLPKEDTVHSSSLQPMKKTDDLTITIKEEPVETDVSADQGKKRKRKSKPVKLVQDYLPDEDEQSDEKEQPKKKSESKPSKRRGRKPKPKVVDNTETEFKCDLCDYVGNKKANLKEHKKRKHRLKFTCDVCQKQFGFNKDLNRHKNQVHADPSHFCDVCQKFYKSKRVFDEHVLTHGENYVKPNFACKLCPKSFSTKYVLAAHIKTEHLGMKKSYMCPTCGRSFTQKNSYIMHANVHAGIKPYICDVCGKAFTYDKSLREHKFMHDNLRRFQCHVCSKTFRQTTSLRIHMKVHKDTKDYMCTSCGKGFTQKQALLRHERIHSGDKPYMCNLCGRAFSDYSIIRRHMMLIHKKDPKDWRGDILSNLKKRQDYYIEGGPGHHVRDLRQADTETGEAGSVGEMDAGKVTDTAQLETEGGMLGKGGRSHAAPSENHSSSQASVQGLSPGQVTSLLPMYHGSTGPSRTKNDLKNETDPMAAMHSSTMHPINYSITAPYSTSASNTQPQSEILNSNLGDVVSPDSYHSQSRQWLNTTLSAPAVSTPSSLPETMRGQLPVPPMPGLSGEATQAQLLAWPYGSYGQYYISSSAPQYPPNSDSHT